MFSKPQRGCNCGAVRFSWWPGENFGVPTNEVEALLKGRLGLGKTSAHKKRMGVKNRVGENKQNGGGETGVFNQINLGGATMAKS